MIKAEKLSYSFPQKELYNKVSFTIEDNVHCAFIGTNGTGKSTLVDMILHPDDHLYAVSYTHLDVYKRQDASHAHPLIVLPEPPSTLPS